MRRRPPAGILTREGRRGEKKPGGANNRRARSLREAVRRGVPLPHDDEHEWVLRARGGDQAAFAALADRYYARLYRWLYSLTQRAHTAEDLAQDAFLKAWAALPTFQPGTSF